MTLWNQNPSALHLCRCQAACHHLYSTFNWWSRTVKHYLDRTLTGMFIGCTSNVTVEKNNHCSASYPLWHYQQVDDDRCISYISQNSRRYTLHKENITWPGCAKNYRPVSNLAYIYTGKLIEKVVGLLRRLNKHMSHHNLHEGFYNFRHQWWYFPWYMRLSEYCEKLKHMTT